MTEHLWNRWPVVVDVSVLTATLAATIVEALSTGSMMALAWVAVLVAAGALAGRYRWPGAAIVIVVTADLTLTLLGHAPVITPMVVLVQGFAVRTRLAVSLAAALGTYLGASALSLLEKYSSRPSSPRRRTRLASHAVPCPSSSRASSMHRHRAGAKS